MGSITPKHVHWIQYAPHGRFCPRISGVYGLIHILTGKIYVGSSNNIYKRYREHRNALRYFRHGSKNLQDLWNAGKEEDFDVKILEEIIGTKKELFDREGIFQEKYKDVLLNTYKNPTGKGKEISKEQIASTARRNMGRTASEETKKLMSESQKKSYESEERRIRHKAGAQKAKSAPGYYDKKRRAAYISWETRRKNKACS